MVGVGEMIASAVVKQVTSRLIKIAGDEIALQWKFKGEVDKMVEKMNDLEAVMHDADNKVSQGGIVGEQVGRWLLKLKSVAYDVEDLLDDLDNQYNEAKLKVFFSRDNQAYQWIARPHNLVDVRKRIEEIENERKPFNLVPQAQVEWSRKNETFAAISDRGTSTGMQGRSAEKEKLVNLILRSQANEHISIIPIVGLGGIGKTTLAQSVYADKRVHIFDIRTWVHVSEKFDLLKITRAITKSIDANINLDNVGLQFLQDCLRVKLAGKKYLIVLDDFWEEGGGNLEELKRMLQHGSSGSRIIVTTRNQNVVKQMKTGVLAHQRVILPVHESKQINLGSLPTNDCWELIKMRAFGPDDDSTPLKKIGYEIAGKCGGIPLVANAFGQVMSEDKSIKAWQDIKMRMVDLGLRSECQNDTLESLKLSYYYMKREFKICFAYLAAFPKGFLIDTNRLIQQWNALGYIYSEYNGESCINYLLGMSFLQISGHPMGILSPVHAKVSQKLIMHDLVHDLASIIAADEFLVLDADSTKPRSWKKAIHCRHAELIQYQNQSNVFDCLPKKLRSLHIRDLQEWQLPPKAFSGSKYMRVLDLACAARHLSQGQSASSKIMLPRSIEKLKLLRYLDATGVPIPSLSKSMCTLQNMETLIMSNCSLETLPNNICSLHKLCYLDLSGNRSLNKLPKSLGMLSKLSFLNLTGCSVLQELPESICQLTYLQHLDISECCAIQNLPDKFGSLPKLIFLNLSGCSKITKLPDNLILESLEYLNLSNCHELENLPKDFGNLQRLGFLSLSDCYKVSLLPESFCQLIHLKFLDLSDCHELRELPEYFGNLFELDSLNLTSCCKLQVLPESLCKLPKLRCLNLSYCMRLDKLPSSFGGLKLQSLDISSAMSLTVLPDSIADMASLTQLEAMVGNSAMMDSVQKIKEHLDFPGIIEHDVHQIENNGCCSIVELAQLTCYDMRVLQLQNVRHPEDAERAKLRDKSDLRLLTLCWGPQGGEGKSVLERLVPPRTLDYFRLLGYMSKDFPKWMSDISSYLPSLTYLSLSDFGTCDTLPPFGQLPNLRSIVMINIPNIRKIGKEFFGQGRPCIKLRSIHLESMGNLAEFWTTRSGEENEEFLIPNLHNLYLVNCPKLKFLPYPPGSMLWYLENIDEIIPEGGFGKLSSSAIPFQMVINNCNFPQENWDRLHHFPTLELLQVESCNGLRALPEVIRCFTSLKSLGLGSLKELESLPKWLGCFISLQRIIIRDCPKITSFPKGMKNLAALKELELQGCKGCDILPEWIGQLTSLQEFQIIDCPNLTSLPESMKDLTSLTKLYIKECRGLAMLPKCLGQLITLQDISIINCPNLTTLPESMKGLTSLTELYIKECQGLAMLPECLGQLITLQKIFIINCPNLTSLPESMNDLSSLTGLYITECQGLAMLPECLGQIISLQRLQIINCPNLTSLPESMNDLSSLTELYIKECQGLAMLPECLGQLITLQKISIHQCPNLISLPESMKKLTALRVLWLKECQRLHVLPEWIQELISLQELNIIRCSNLTSLPESIQNLTSLKELYIWDCPSLVERCKGEDAGLISHIPKVTLHYEPEE